MRTLFGTCLVMAVLSSLAAAEGRKLAVVVGVGTYRATSGLPPLGESPANDAANVARVLRAQGFTVFEMTHKAARQPGQETLAPNFAYISDQIAGVLGYPNLGPEDAIVIALSGHGVQFDQVDEMGNKSPRFYFCPADATISGIRNANELTQANQLLPLHKLYEQFGDCTAATRLLIVDACRNDPSQPGIFREALASASLPKLPPPPGGTAAFLSCKPNQRAVQDAELGQGVFMHFLVQGMNGFADQPLANGPPDGIVTFAELSTYVANNTYAHVYSKFGVQQSPELQGDFDLNLPLSKVAMSWEGTQAGEVREFGGEPRIKLCWCPPGKFLMGTPNRELERFSDIYPELNPTSKAQQVHVTITRGYWMGQTEVTRELWQNVMGTTPWSAAPFGARGPQAAAGLIYHGDLGDGRTAPNSAVDFCRRLTDREQAARRLPANYEFRLPTEAEWEYACRAGTTTAYCFGEDTDLLHHYADYAGSPREVRAPAASPIPSEPEASPPAESKVKPPNGNTEAGKRRPNAWNLYDFHGSVREWCLDTLQETLPGGADPLVQSPSEVKVARGGQYNVSAGNCRSASRGGMLSMGKDWATGFRIVIARVKK